MAKVKRSQVKTFLNIGTPAAPVWALIGPGVVTGALEYNPSIVSETYIHEDNATTNIDSYAPNFPVEMVANNTDTVFEYLDNLRKLRSVLEDAETEVVNVWLYETPAGGYYPAEKQSVSIQIDSFGGDGGAAAKINYVLNFLGDPVTGAFKPAATATFEAVPVTTVLTTMAITGATLAPLFAANPANLLYTSSVATGVTSVTMASTLAGATIVQKVGASVVAQAGSAALAVGVNNLTIEVTVGSEVNTYRIDITRAAA